MYLDNVKKPFKMLRYPRMLWHFYGVNLYKVVRTKICKDNIFLERARQDGKAVSRRFLSNEEFNAEIKRRLHSEEPFFCCRYGNSELTACFIAMIKKLGIIDRIDEKALERAKSGPGVFPKKEDVYEKFCEIYAEALSHADLNAYWGSVLMEEYLIDKYQRKDCLQYAMRALEPFAYDEPWTQALRGKKVLVVHPFADLIESQYKKRNVIFPNKEILPDCELTAVRAIQSSGNSYPEGISDWFEGLDILYHRCMEKDFEVALVSCGSYAVPLAAKLKRGGRRLLCPVACCS